MPPLRATRPGHHCQVQLSEGQRKTQNHKVLTNKCQDIMAAIGLLVAKRLIVDKAKGSSSLHLSQAAQLTNLRSTSAATANGAPYTTLWAQECQATLHRPSTPKATASGATSHSKPGTSFPPSASEKGLCSSQITLRAPVVAPNPPSSDN